MAKIPKNQGTLFGEEVTPLRLKGTIIRSEKQLGKTKIAMQAMIDLEKAKKDYLSQFRHRRCGGNPVAYVFTGEGSFLSCTKCGLLQLVPPGEPLGTSVKSKHWEAT